MPPVTRTLVSGNGSIFGATSRRVKSRVGAKGGGSGGREGAACWASAGVAARIAAKLRRVVFMGAPVSLHSPALHAGGESVLELHFQTQARRSHGLKRD